MTALKVTVLSLVAGMMLLSGCSAQKAENSCTDVTTTTEDAIIVTTVATSVSTEQKESGMTSTTVSGKTSTTVSGKTSTTVSGKTSTTTKENGTLLPTGQQTTPYDDENNWVDGSIP